MTAGQLLASSNVRGRFERPMSDRFNVNEIRPDGGKAAVYIQGMGQRTRELLDGFKTYLPTVSIYRESFVQRADRLRPSLPVIWISVCARFAGPSRSSPIVARRYNVFVARSS